jgi:hypothetical protein
MQRPKSVEKTLEFGWGGKKGREKEDARKTCKRRRSLELTHLYVLRASSTTTTPIAFILRNAHPDTLDDRFFFNFLVKWI